MVSQRVINLRAREIVQETGVLLEVASEMAAAELDPTFSDHGHRLPKDEVNRILDEQIAIITAEKRQTASVA